MVKRFTPTLLSRKAGSKRQEFRDVDSPLILRVQPTGARSFVCRHRIGDGRQVVTFTSDFAVAPDNVALAQAWARRIVEQCRAGQDPRETAEASKREKARLERTKFGPVCETFIKREVSKLRSAQETKRIFETYVLPRWEDRQIGDIRRSEVVALLDEIEAGEFETADGRRLGGPVQADRVLAHIRRLFNWHATRDDDFVSPVVKGMARTKPKQRARTRVLSDDEIRLICPCLKKMGPYGAIVQTLFLTDQRRGEVAQMRRSQIGQDGIWEIPAANYKTGVPQFVPLTDAALAIIQAQPVYRILRNGKLVDSDLVFSLTGEAEFQLWDRAKRELDKRIMWRQRALVRQQGRDPSEVKPFPDWRLHDIRRTARSLMSRAGVRPDVAERVMGHAIPGVAGVYDRHAYVDEKRDALERLAAEIDRILDPPAGNVVRLRQTPVAAE